MKEIVKQMMAAEQAIEKILMDLNVELHKESLQISTVDLSTITDREVPSHTWFECRVVMGTLNNH